VIKIGLTSVDLVDGALVWEAGLAIDADGSPRAYAPPGMHGLDLLANAGHPGNWWGVVTDVRGQPVVQGQDDPAPGRYVSTTALVDRRYGERDPRRYVDSEKVPYLSVPKVLLHSGAKLGDVAAVVNRVNGEVAAAVVADIGPADRIGEGSIRLAQQLGLNADPRHGGVSAGIAVALFAGSGLGWYRAQDEVDRQALDLFESWGGVTRLLGA
jgi:hypothetical protein